MFAGLLVTPLLEPRFPGARVSKAPVYVRDGYVTDATLEPVRLPKCRKGPSTRKMSCVALELEPECSLEPEANVSHICFLATSPDAVQEMPAAVEEESMDACLRDLRTPLEQRRHFYSVMRKQGFSVQYIARAWAMHPLVIERKDAATQRKLQNMRKRAQQHERKCAKKARST